MYFPYLRGRQYELLCLRELSENIISNRKVLPIIEPVRDNASVLKSYKIFAEVRLPFVFIINPQVGELIDDNTVIKDEIIGNILSTHNNYYIGYIISRNTTLEDIQNFLGQHRDIYKCLIHYHSFQNSEALLETIVTCEDVKYNIFIQDKTSEDYKTSFQGNNWENILIKDGFVKQLRNADYPPDDYFSDLLFTYRDLSYDGFGDFSIIGDDYSQGFSPHAVAIHFTYIKSNPNELRVRHFISDRTRTLVDPGGKFLEALRKLVRYLNSTSGSNFRHTNGADDFIHLFSRSHYPGLGSVKKLSIKHHIELIQENLD